MDISTSWRCFLDACFPDHFAKIKGFSDEETLFLEKKINNLEERSQFVDVIHLSDQNLIDLNKILSPGSNGAVIVADRFKKRLELIKCLNLIGSCTEFIVIGARSPRLIISLSKKISLWTGFSIYEPTKFTSRLGLFLIKLLLLFGLSSVLSFRRIIIFETNKYASSTCDWPISPSHIYSWYIGTPGFSRKSICLYKNRNNKFSIQKHGDSKNSSHSVSKEAKVLAELNKSDIAEFIPEIINYTELPGRTFLTTPFYTGNHISVKPHSTELLNFFYLLKSVNKCFISSEIYNQDFVFFLKQSFCFSQALSLLLINKFNATEKFCCHLAHNDFASWNMKITKGGLKVFDWELSSRHGIAGTDIFYFCFSYPLCVSKKKHDLLASYRNARFLFSSVYGAEICSSLIDIYFLIWVSGLSEKNRDLILRFVISSKVFVSSLD